MLKPYKDISDWEQEVLKEHPTAVFEDHGNTIAPTVKTGDITCKFVGLFCKGNKKGEVHDE